MGDFRVLLAELASSRTDALPSKKRAALVETVLTAISSQEDPGVRKLLAEWNGMFQSLIARICNYDWLVVAVIAQVAASESSFI